MAQLRPSKLPRPSAVRGARPSASTTCAPHALTHPLLNTSPFRTLRYVLVGNQVQLFYLGTGAETHKFTVDFLALSGRLTLVKGLRPFVWLSGSSPGTVALLDTATGKMHARVDELEDAVFGLDVSPVDR